MMEIVTVLAIVGFWFAVISNQVVYRAGFWKGTHLILSEMSQLADDFSLRESEDPNYQKVRKEFDLFLMRIQVEKIKPPSLFWDMWGSHFPGKKKA